MTQLKFYYIDFPQSQMQYDVGFVSIKSNDYSIQTPEICRLLNANGYDIVDYNTDISILVDDNGFYKSGLPVWNIKTPDGHQLQLIGKLLFVRNVETEDSVEIVSIRDEDVSKLLNDLDIKLLGLKK